MSHLCVQQRKQRRTAARKRARLQHTLQALREPYVAAKLSGVAGFWFPPPALRIIAIATNDPISVQAAIAAIRALPSEPCQAEPPSHCPQASLRDPRGSQ